MVIETRFALTVCPIRGIQLRKMGYANPTIP
jgi:hypothetical protein